MWETLLQTAAPALMGGALSYLHGSDANKQAGQKQANYQNAINYLQNAQQTPSQGFFGSAGPNGITTGTGYDQAIRGANAAQLGQQLAAARLNLARGNLTDAQARAKAYAQQVAQNAANRNGATNTAARLGLMYGNRANMNDIYRAARRDQAGDNQRAYADAMGVIANNDANYMNNPALLDAIRQSNNYGDRQNQYNGMLAQLMAYQPTQGVGAGTAAALGAISGLGSGISDYFTNQALMNFDKK